MQVKVLQNVLWSILQYFLPTLSNPGNCLDLCYVIFEWSLNTGFTVDENADPFRFSEDISLDPSDVDLFTEKRRYRVHFRCTVNILKLVRITTSREHCNKWWGNG